MNRQVQCCVCLKLRNGDKWEAWPYKEMRASHTYCPPCADLMRKAIQEHRPINDDKRLMDQRDVMDKIQGDDNE